MVTVGRYGNRESSMSNADHLLLVSEDYHQDEDRSNQQPNQRQTNHKTCNK